MPVGMDKFWQIQLLIVCMPSFMFTCFVNLQAGKRDLEARRRKAEMKSLASSSILKNPFQSVNQSQPIDDMDDKMSKADDKDIAAVMHQRKEKVKFRLKGKEVIEVVWSRPIRTAFLFHLILRAFIEVSFLIFGYMLQGKNTVSADYNCILKLI